MTVRRVAWGAGLTVLGLVTLFVFTALRSGPLAPIPVTVTRAGEAEITPSLEGIGIVEAQRLHRIGPVQPGRLLQLTVDVGDRVQAGQLLGRMDPVDLEQRLAAQQAALSSMKATLEQARSRLLYARKQAERYRQLLASGAISQEQLDARQNELEAGQAALEGAEDNVQRLIHEWSALQAVREQLELRSPVDGLVVNRLAAAGDSLMAGQTVVEILDPATLWVTARFDQANSRGLADGQPATIRLRSRPATPLAGRVLRLEPLADPVSEERVARILFHTVPEPLPPLGELAEVSVQLPRLPASVVVPSAALVRHEGRTGVWALNREQRLHFLPVQTGQADADGRVQILQGLDPGTTIVVHSDAPLDAHSRIRPQTTTPP